MPSDPNDHAPTADVTLLETVLEAMDRVGLEAILVGNAAAALHGAPVTTQDLDFFVRDAATVRRKIHRLANELGGVARPVGELSDTLRIEGNLPDLDFLFTIGPFKFESVRRKSRPVSPDYARVFIAPLEIVIQSKEHFDRDKDRATLPVLRKTLEVIRAMEDEGMRRPAK